MASSIDSPAVDANFGIQLVRKYSVAKDKNSAIHN
jgi:hypothetical protein